MLQLAVSKDRRYLEKLVASRDEHACRPSSASASSSVLSQEQVYLVKRLARRELSREV